MIMADQIKAVVMTAPGQIEIQELPWPKLKPGGLILKMNLAGICGTDKHAYKGEKVLYGGTEAEQEIVYPGVRGHENVGTIVEIRQADQDQIEYHGARLKVGDRVTMCPNIICKNCWYCRHILAYPFCAHNTTIGLSYKSTEWPYVAGGWADYMYVPDGSWVYKVPDAMTDEMAVLTELFVVAATLDRAKEFSRMEARGFGFADTVGIQGCGAIGLMHIIKAKMLGAWQIVAIDPSEEKLKLAKEFGATHTINISKTTKEERVDFCRSITEGRGLDVAVETVGQAEVIAEGIEMCRRGGTYIETGNFVDTGNVTLNAHRHLAAKNLLLIGNCNHPHTGYYQAMNMMVKYAAEYPWAKLITHRFRLDQGKEAMETSLKPDPLKVIFEM
jgi:threonine dehydrogenase-like Zn-dependent dehydrogenase